MLFLLFINNIFLNIFWWLFLLMKSRKMKSTMMPVFIFLINFRNETMLVKQKVMGVFEKNVKTCLENKKVYLMPYSRHGHFHLILILPVNMVELPQQHANIVHWL